MNKQDHIDILEEAVKEFSERYGETCQYVESLKYAISILQTKEVSISCNQLTTDTINRQEALDAMDTWDKFGCDPSGMLGRYDDDKHYVPYVHYDDMVHVIKSLPPAQPELITISIDHEMTQEECEMLRRQMADAPIVLLPSAQPEIVRCKDCKHWINGHLCEALSRFGSFETKADFYCGYAKRKADEEVN